MPGAARRCLGKAGPRGDGSGGRRLAPARRREAVGLAAALLGLFLYAGGCESERNQSIVESPAGPMQVVEQMTLRESQAGHLRWVLRADSAMVYEENERTLLRGVHVDFYGGERDTIRSTLTAREGEVDMHTRKLIARRDVVIRTAEGHSLETEELHWDPELGKVFSDRFVRLTRGESVLTGMGIESDPELHSYAIRSEVQGEVREEDPILDDF
jgi:LPS export ABC transporter protein LptC